VAREREEVEGPRHVEAQRDPPLDGHRHVEEERARRSAVEVLARLTRALRASRVVQAMARRHGIGRKLTYDNSATKTLTDKLKKRWLLVQCGATKLPLTELGTAVAASVSFGPRAAAHRWSSSFHLLSTPKCRPSRGRATR